MATKRLMALVIIAMAVEMFASAMSARFQLPVVDDLHWLHDDYRSGRADLDEDIDAS
jgi:hypothetical protein